MSIVNNHFSGQLPSTMGLRLPHLQNIYFAANQLNGPIPKSICNASQLNNLDMSFNLFSGFIPSCLGNLRKLQVLFLQVNFLTSKDSNFLSSLRNCKSLKDLRVSFNAALNIEISNTIGNLSSLIHFRAFNCSIKGNIPSEISHLSNLIRLDLGYNQLIGTIPSSIGRLHKLQGLSFSYNNIQGSIPHELCHMESLSELYLDGNMLSGSIPSCINNLTSLRKLYLGYNRFSSRITPSLWDLKYMMELMLSFNSFNGSLPTEIATLKVVQIIDLSMNQLSNNVPKSIGSLTSLTYLNLSGNMLEGNIPQSFGDLISLEYLDLSSNNLSGVIPQSMEKLKYLQYLNVSFNNLEGEIPEGGQFFNFSAQSFLGNKALCGAARIKVPSCRGSTQQSKKHIKFVLKYTLPVIAFVLGLAIAFLVLYMKKYKRNENVPTEGESELFPNWRRISYYELECATNGFQEHNLLGIGSFGSVYKGTLSNGMIVAVKVFNLQMEDAFKSFDVECQVLQKLRHRNLVKIITNCCSHDFKALVMKFMPNWSLEKWLYSHNYFLNIHQRLNIMLDVAFALEYLHHEFDTPVVHCDLKPSNILLNEDMIAHVCDFGITKFLGEGNLVTHTITLATVGYMAPEYGLEGIVSTKGDVYSYGILLMETFMRKKPIDEMFAGELSLKKWVEQNVPHAVTQIVDANLLTGDQEEHYQAKKICMESIFILALQCVVDFPEKRISMKDVVISLNKIKMKLLNDVN